MKPIQSSIVEDHSSDGNRSGEGAAVTLKDGSLFLVYGRFSGGGDASAAKLVSRRSEDGGRNWSAPELFFMPEPGWINAMSVSLLRLQDERLAALFLVKLTHDICVPYWMTSDDEAVSWTVPRRMIANNGYYVINNDRLVQLRSGRLLAPYAFSDRINGCGLPLSGCLISDDAGATWRHGRQEFRVLPETYHIPDNVVADATPALRLFGAGQVCTQEPGVIGLTDGRVMMWARSNGGCAYAAFSSDQGDTWTPFTVLCKTPMANGPATIKRVPGTGRLIMLHNDRSGVPFGDATFQWRTPLAVSVSDDEGATWQPHAPLVPDDSHNYCYYSMCFFENHCLVTTYESADFKEQNGVVSRQNLRSLRTITVNNTWWS